MARRQSDSVIGAMLGLVFLPFTILFEIVGDILGEMAGCLMFVAFIALIASPFVLIFALLR